MLSYKYDFELSTKQKTHLWLYQVIPNIDIPQDIQTKTRYGIEDITCGMVLGM